MRRDVYIENDSGGFSVLAADAVDAIIEDQREDDFKFVESHKAMLIELYGDDSMPIRIVVDEPLTQEEQDQWVARYSWEIATSDGRMIAMGGFDPDVLSWWKESGEADHADGRGVGTFTAAPGRWRVDVYAHGGSMNGRVILSEEATEKPGAAYRRSHGDRPFPLWLAKMLEFSGEDDPGYEELWNDVKANMKAGTLAIDVESGDAIGFLVHVTRPTTKIGDPPKHVWIDRSTNARQPSVFPLGLRSEVPDLNLRMFYDKLLDIKHPQPPRPIAEDFIEIISSWPGETLKKVDGGPVAVGVEELYLLHWMAGFMSDITPRFELWVEPKGAWTPPAATPDFALKAGGSLVAIGPISNSAGWHTWWASRLVAQALGTVPDGSTITLACLPDQKERSNPGSTAGIAIYEATVRGGQCMLSEAAPKVSAKTLQDALTFMRELLANRMHVRPEERKAFEKTARRNFVPEGGIVWNGDVASLADPDDRTHLFLAPMLFRARFGDTWPFDREEVLEDNA
jgi:hypothetical protein